MVLQFISENVVKVKEILDKEDVLIAVSGGVDSILLLDLLNELSEKNKIHVIHFNHNLRKESENEFKEVEKICKNYGCVFHGIELNVRNYMKTNHVSMETGARELRYYWFKNLSKELKIKHVFLGHHADDLMETIIMRMVKGSLGKGLIGMSFENKVDNVTYVRPLLNRTKEEIYVEAKKRNLFWFEDDSNSDETILRNDIRNNILPELKKLNSKVQESFSKISNERKETEEFLDEILKDIEEENLNNLLDVGIGYDKDFYLNLKPILRKRALESMVKSLLGSSYIFSKVNLDNAVNSFITKNVSSKMIEIDKNLYIVSDYDKFWIVPKHMKLKLNMEYTHKVNSLSYTPLNDCKNLRVNGKKISKILVESKVAPAFREGYVYFKNGKVSTVYDYLGRIVKEYNVD